MKRLSSILIFIFISAIGNIEAAQVFAADQSVEKQVVQFLSEEAAKGKVKAGVLGITYSVIAQEDKLSESQLKALEEDLTDKFIASLMKEIRASGNREKISIIERGRLDEILKEKKLQLTGLTENTASEIGGLAGLDIILLGSIRGQNDPSSISVKVIKVKDGEILGIAEQKKERIILVDEVENLKASSWKAFPISLSKSGDLSLNVSVVRGNPVNIDMIPSSELEKFKKRIQYKHFVNFEASKTKNYRRSGYITEGIYYLVITDNTLGVLSLPSSDIKITAQLEPRTEQ